MFLSWLESSALKHRGHFCAEPNGESELRSSRRRQQRVMPHVVLKGSEDGRQSVVFGLSRSELAALCSHSLAPWGNRVGQDGQTFNNAPLQVLSVLEQSFGYRVLTSTTGPHASAIWTLHTVQSYR